MRPEQWQEVKRLVEGALELPLEERLNYLAAVEDEELRREAHNLLAVSETRADAFDQIRIFPPGNDFPFKEGDLVGHYLILREVNRGGMGTVFEARDERNGRIVALKILPPRLLPFSPNEERALARLSHPNIATFYESGSTPDGFRFVAMEYVEGVTITSFCDARCPTIRSRLALFRKVCSAVEYAHGHLVVHRDLKPDNILVTGEGEPKLLDFGIAKILPAGLATPTLTSVAERPLTVAFASPEHLGGEPTTTTTDVYSLGVLLCLLLTGHLPYKVKSLHDLPWAIRNMEPSRPSALVVANAEARKLLGGTPERLRRRLEGDLDAIVLRALRKEPDLRYRSVAELSENIRRHLDHEPVSALKGTRRYRAGKFFERHRLGVTVAAAGILVLLAFTVALVVLERRTLRERDAARREARRSEAVSAFLVDIFRVSNPWTTLGSTLTAREVLDDASLKLRRHPPADPAVRGTLLRSLGRINLNLSAYAPADALLEPALEEVRRTYPENRTLIAEILSDLATVRYHHARYAEAERYATQAMVIYQADGNRPKMLEERSLLGRISFDEGRYSVARRLFREELALADELHGPASLHAGSARNDLACALHAEGKYAEARVLYEQSLLIRKHLLGDSHPAVLQVRHNLACLTRDQGDIATAEDDFVAVRLAYRKISDPNYPSIPTLFHNLGTTLLSAGKLDEAELALFDSLAGFRWLLPDEHPSIGRALSEFGRLAAARRQDREAEDFYRNALERLEWSLGKDHPDTITTANNLAALRAREGRRSEAEGIWRELLRRTRAHPLRPDLDAVLRENLALLLRKKKETRPEAYMTAGIEMLDIADSPDYLEITPGGAPLPRFSSRGPDTIRFFDDFADGTVDPKRWEYGGSTVREENGELHVLTAVTDHGGQARTLPFPVDPTRPLTIARRVKVHAANEFFDGKMTVGITGYPEKNFGVSYANYHYTGAGECVTVGFSIVRRNASSHRYADRRTNVSPLLSPLFDRWFDEELRYDPQTGEVRYVIDGTERLTYNVGPLPPNASSMTLTFFPWGWYTGHYQTMDWVRVGQ